MSDQNNAAFSHGLKRLFCLLRDYEDKTALLTLGSIAINAFTGVGKFFVGVGARSAWTTVNALYYLVLCAARVWTLHAYYAQKKIAHMGKRRYRACLVYRRGGTFLCVIGVSYFLVCACMLFTGASYQDRGDLAAFSAGIALSKLVLALWGVRLTRQKHGRITQTLKMLAASDASVSVSAALCTVLALVSPRAASLGALFGMACAVVFVVCGARMRARVLCMRRGRKCAVRCV